MFRIEMRLMLCCRRLLDFWLKPCSRCRGTKAAMGVIRHFGAVLVNPASAMYLMHQG